MQRRAMTDADACRSDNGGKCGHRRHRSNAEGGDVADSRASRRQCQCWKYAEKMRAAGDAVQNPHAEGRVRMSDAARPCRPCVNVDMVVLYGAMVMSAGRNVQRAPQRPEADSDQRDTNNPFAPRRQNVNRRQ